ncbi:MAG: hypothetical protein AcusKO_14230 [Acuticoccus sp.]
MVERIGEADLAGARAAVHNAVGGFDGGTLREIVSAAAGALTSGGADVPRLLPDGALPPLLDEVLAASAADPLDAIDWFDYTAPGGINVYISGGGQNVREMDNNSAYKTRPLDAAETAAIMDVLDNYEAVADVAFTIVEDIAEADFVIMESNNATSALGYFEVGGGPLRYDGTVYDLEGWGVMNGKGAGWTTAGVAVGGYGYVTLIHEFGHGMGLAHPHDDGGGSDVMNGVSSPFNDYGSNGLNQGVFTTMSYNDGWPTSDHGTSGSDDYGWQGTLMALDIAALQRKYGANMTTNAGDDVYVLPEINAPGTFYSCIWDVGGIDRIEAGGATNVVIDLRAATLDYSGTGGGPVSFAKGIYGGFTIASQVEIEDATGGGGNDLLIGNDLANTILGEGGKDSILGNGGRDTIDGGAGKDTIDGGSGSDSLTGGNGVDSILGGGGRDIIDGGAGNDRLEGGGGIDYFVVAGDWGKDRIADFSEGTDQCVLLLLRDLNGGAALTFDQIILTDVSEGTRMHLDIDEDGTKDQLDLDGDGDIDKAHVTFETLTADQLSSDDFMF